MEILLIGCGKMGGALKRCWQKKHPVSVISKTNPRYHKSVADLGHNYIPDVMVLAIKPQQLREVYPLYRDIAKKCLVISVAAGVSVHDIEEGLHVPNRVCRAMPNIAVAHGFGMTGLVAPASLPTPFRMIAEELFELTGDCVWVDEVHIDLLATLSGSGPAYIFKFCELMAEVSGELGLPKEMAARLARQTLLGTGALLANSEVSLAELRQAVTSPGGMTAAGLEQLTQGDVVYDRLRELFNASIKRAKDLRELEVGDL